MKSHFYDPDLGRFLQVDPKREFWNSYSYVGNNPVMGTDPTGMAEIKGFNGDQSQKSIKFHLQRAMISLSKNKNPEFVRIGKNLLKWPVSIVSAVGPQGKGATSYDKTAKGIVFAKGYSDLFINDLSDASEYLKIEIDVERVRGYTTIELIPLLIYEDRHIEQLANAILFFLGDGGYDQTKYISEKRLMKW